MTREQELTRLADREIMREFGYDKISSTDLLVLRGTLRYSVIKLGLATNHLKEAVMQSFNLKTFVIVWIVAFVTVAIVFLAINPDAQKAFQAGRDAANQQQR